MANRAAHLLRHAAERPDAVAIIAGTEELSFRDLEMRVRALAAGLGGRGVQARHRIGLYLPASPDFIVAQQALFLLGAVVTPINTLYRPGEIRHAAACCGLDFIVTTQQLADAFEGGAGCPLIPVEELSSPLPAFAAELLVDLDDGDIAMMLLTSATTGKAKGVMLTVGNLAANYDQTPEWLGLAQDSVILCALPLYNTFGLNQCINAMLVTGCRMVLLPRFDAEQCIAAIARHRCTFLPAVPTMLQRIVDHPAAGDASLGSLRTVMTGGAPVPSTLLRRLLAAAPNVELLTGYGLTEATALVTLTRVELDGSGRIRRERTIGRTLAGMELAILDEGGSHLPDGAIGEIAIRGPNVMAGYYNAPEESRVAVPDGWLRSGDIGYQDADGYAFIVDRKKDVIIRGGQNIYPADIEECLYELPDVAEVAVVAQPDCMLGEVPLAFVALGRGSGLSIAAMLDHCRAALAPYKVPVDIVVRDELPKGPTGKILRRALRPIPAAI